MLAVFLGAGLPSLSDPPGLLGTVPFIIQRVLDCAIYNYAFNVLFRQHADVSLLRRRITLAPVPEYDRLSIGCALRCSLGPDLT